MQRRNVERINPATLRNAVLFAGFDKARQANGEFELDRGLLPRRLTTLG
jgi:hypothetical protein